MPASCTPHYDAIPSQGHLRNPKNDELRSRQRVLEPLITKYEAELEALNQGAALAGSAGTAADEEGEDEDEDAMDDVLLSKYGLAQEMDSVVKTAAEDVELQADAVRKGLRAVMAVAEDADALAAKGRAALRQDFEMLYPGSTRPAQLIQALAGAGAGAGAASGGGSGSAAASTAVATESEGGMAGNKADGQG